MTGTVEAVLPGLELPSGPNREPVVVQLACDEDAGQWLCVTHGMMFGNQLQKDGHVAEDGHHLLAWHCYSHGPETP